MDSQAPTPRPARPEATTTSTKKPWPLSWVFIAILIYVTLQVGYYLFFGE